SALELGVGTPQARSAERSEVGRHRRAQHAGIDEVCSLAEEAMLLDHIRGGERGASEHQLGMDADTLRPQRSGVEGLESLRALDEAEAALWGYDLDDLRGIALGAGESKHDVGAGEAGRSQLRQKRLAVVDHMLGAEALDPVLRLPTRGGGDDGEARQLARELD